MDYYDQVDEEEIVYDSESDVTSNQPNQIPHHKLYGAAHKIEVEIPEKA